MDQTTNQGSSTKWYIIGAVVVVAALALWYVYTPQTPAGTETPTSTTETPASDQAQTPAPVSGNTTADISAQLNQVPDSSAGLNADASAVSGDLQSL